MRRKRKNCHARTAKLPWSRYDQMAYGAYALTAAVLPAQPAPASNVVRAFSVTHANGRITTQPIRESGRVSWTPRYWTQELARRMWLKNW